MKRQYYLSMQICHKTIHMGIDDLNKHCVCLIKNYSLSIPFVCSSVSVVTVKLAVFTFPELGKVLGITIA